MPILHKSAPQVALFSARGPNIKDFSFQDADLLKPDILAPGSLIWAAWSPNGTDEPNYVGKNSIDLNFLSLHFIFQMSIKHSPDLHISYYVKSLPLRTRLNRRISGRRSVEFINSLITFFLVFMAIILQKL